MLYILKRVQTDASINCATVEKERKERFGTNREEARHRGSSMPGERPTPDPRKGPPQDPTIIMRKPLEQKIKKETKIYRTSRRKSSDFLLIT